MSEMTNSPQTIGVNGILVKFLLPEQTVRIVHTDSYKCAKKIHFTYNNHRIVRYSYKYISGLIKKVINVL